MVDSVGAPSSTFSCPQSSCLPGLTPGLFWFTELIALPPLESLGFSRLAAAAPVAAKPN